MLAIDDTEVPREGTQRARARSCAPEPAPGPWLAQSDLADMVGVRRQWVVGVERGTSNPRMDLFLRALAVLGLDLSVSPSSLATEAGPGAAADLDELLSGYK